MSEALEFIENLPRATVTTGDRADILAQLKSRPGEWALVRRDVSKGWVARYPFPGTESFTESFINDEGKKRYRVFLRWMDGSPGFKLTWQDPPESFANQHELRQEVERAIAQLKRRPGQWAIVEKVEGTVNHSRRMKWKRRGVEVVTRSRDGDSYIYARWPKNA